MKVVFASSEIAPFVKTGGLADVSGALPGFISRDGFEIIAVMPMYRAVNRGRFNFEFIGEIDVPHAGGTVKAGVYSGRIPGFNIPVFFIEYGPFFDREGIYQEDGKEYDDNDSRFGFFSRAVLETCRHLNFQADVIHCNDWQTGLIPVYLKTLYRGDRFFFRTSVLFTIHNLSYRGLFDPEKAINSTGLPRSVFSMHGVEFYGKFSFLKGGIYYADLINTVSLRYSREIQTEEYGEGLHGLLYARSGSLSGIINGVDYGLWNPQTDSLIEKNYNSGSIDYKKINTRHLCRIAQIDYDGNVPLLGMVTRLSEQKGLDLLSEITDELMAKELRMVILGTGEERYHHIFNAYAERYPGRMSVFIKHDDELAHMIYAGSDIFLMPSRFEPCGLSQIISLKYGTVPVVRETGGLADTITGYGSYIESGEAKANGFVFREYSSSALLDCIDCSIKVFNDKAEWGKLMRNGMECDFSWSVSAEKYEALYSRLYSMKNF